MKAVILLSGGLDSTVMLALALEQKRHCYTISFDYNQRHRIELESATAIAEHYKVPHQRIKIDPTCFASSALVSKDHIPVNRTLHEIAAGGIPSTYVPARNSIFLAYALGYAELVEAEEIYFGCNIMDRNAYPDCRPAFVEAFQNLINFATKQSVESKPPKLMTPLIDLNKNEIIQQGVRLKAPIHLSFSCYNPTAEDLPCGQCDACVGRGTLSP